MSKKVTVTQLRAIDKAIDKGMEHEIELQGVEITLKITNYLPIEDKVGLAQKIIAGSNIGNSSRYAIERIVTKTEIVRAYTNVSLPSSLDDAYNLITKTGLYDLVIEKMNDSERVELFEIIEDIKKGASEVEELSYSTGFVMGNFLDDIGNSIENMVGKLPSSEDTESLIEKAVEGVNGLDSTKVQELIEFVSKD